MESALICYRSSSSHRRAFVLFSGLLILVQILFWKELLQSSRSNPAFGSMTVTGLMTIVFACFVLAAVRGCLKLHPYLVINSEGITVQSGVELFISWKDIRDIKRSSDLFGHWHVNLMLREPNSSAGRHRRVVSLIITSLDKPPEVVWQTIMDSASKARSSGQDKDRAER
jgi:hypothetical protein